MKKLSILFGMALLMAATFTTGTGSASAATRIGGNQGKLLIYAVDSSTAPNMPVAGAAVTIFDVNGQEVPTTQDATDANGMFTTLLDAGVYTVTVNARGYDGFTSAVKVASSEGTSLTAKLSSSPTPLPCSSCEPSPCLSCDTRF